MTLERTRNDIILRALLKIGAVASGESSSAEDIQDAAIELDYMVKEWQATGAHLWSRNSAVVFVQPAQIEYQLGGVNTDNATESFVETTLSAAAAAAAINITLTSTTGITDGDFIGIRLDAGSIHWTTVKTASVTSLDDAMPTAAASGNAVFTYTTKIGKALRIPDARRQQGLGTTSQEIEMIPLGRIDYLNLPNKNTSGTPVQFYYDPKKDFGELFLWPAPTKNDTIIRITYYRPLDVFDTSNSAPDFPNEWISAIVYNLAWRLGPEYGQQLSAVDINLAIKLKEDALDWDQGDASTYFEPDKRYAF